MFVVGIWTVDAKAPRTITAHLMRVYRSPYPTYKAKTLDIISAHHSGPPQAIIRAAGVKTRWQAHCITRLQLSAFAENLIS